MDILLICLKNCFFYKINIINKDLYDFNKIYCHHCYEFINNNSTIYCYSDTYFCSYECRKEYIFYNKLTN